MESTFSKIFFISANNERIKEFMIKGKEAHDEITCDAKNCSVEIFLKVLYDFVLNDELSYDDRRVKFIDVGKKSTHFLLFIKPNTARSCLNF